MKGTRIRESTGAPTCGPNEAQALTECYDKFPAGQDGVFAWCTPGCPAGMFQCGFLCTPSVNECVDWVAKVGQDNVELGVAIYTRDGLGFVDNVLGQVENYVHPICGRHGTARPVY